MSPWYGSGIDLIEAVQSALAPGMNAFWRGIAELGTFQFYVAAIAVVYWTWGKRRGVELYLVILGQGAANASLKIVAAQPRPYWVGRGVIAIATERTYGLGSGHASGATAFYGWLAVAVRQWWMWMLAIAMIALVGFSRLYLGVHFPQDLVVGCLIGVAALIIVPPLAGRYWDLWMRASPSFLVVAGAVGAGVVIGVWGAAWGIAYPRADPSSWAVFAVQARASDGFVEMGATYFGASCGWIAARNWVDTRLGGPWFVRVLAVVAGLVVVGVIQTGIGSLAPDAGAAQHITEFIAAAVAAAVIIAGLPWAFRRLGLETENLHAGAPVAPD